MFTTSFTLAFITVILNILEINSRELMKQLNEKQDDAIPSSVNSRFFDFGGPSNPQSGFNYPAAHPTFPINSQFYPGFQNPQPIPNGQGSQWPVIDDAKTYPNQGHNYGGIPSNQNPYQFDNGGFPQGPYPDQGSISGFPSPQNPSQPNFGFQNPNGPNFGAVGLPPPTPYPNWGEYGNYQPTPYPSQGNFGSYNRPQYPDYDNGVPRQNPNVWGGRPQMPDQQGSMNQNPNNFWPGNQNGDGSFDGVQSGFGPRPRIPSVQIPNDTINNGMPQTMPGQTPPDYMDNDSVAILGRPVIVPETTTSKGQIVFPTSTENAAQKQCVQDCQSSSEYNPVCGTNNVTYINPGKFFCARNCGVRVFVQLQGTCPR